MWPFSKKRDVFVITAPEGLDLWNDNDTEAQKIRASCIGILEDLIDGKDSGVFLPFGFELKVIHNVKA